METKKINYKKELKEAVDIALFKHPVMHAVAMEKHRTMFGYYIIIAGAILSIIGTVVMPGIFSPGLTLSLIMGVFQVVMSVAGIYIMSFIAVKFFKGQAHHDEFFRVTAYGMIITWLGLIPVISFISGLWAIALLFVILKVVHKLSTKNAIFTMVIGAIAMWIIAGILSPIYGRIGGYSMMNGARFNGNMGSIDFGREGKVEMGGNVMKYTDETGKTVEVQLPNIGQ